MYYTFEGRDRNQNFFFTRYCENEAVVQQVIEKASKSFVGKSYTVRRKITQVTDELGIVIYRS